MTTCTRHDWIKSLSGREWPADLLKPGSPMFQVWEDLPVPDRPSSEDPDELTASDLTSDALGPRTWWVYLQLTGPRSVADLALTGGITSSSIRTHLNRLKALELVAPQPGLSGSAQVWARTSTELDPDLLDQIRAKSDRVTKVDGAEPGFTSTEARGTGTETDEESVNGGPSDVDSPLASYEHKTRASMEVWLVGAVAAVTLLGIVLTGIFATRDDAMTHTAAATPSAEPTSQVSFNVPAEEPEAGDPPPEVVEVPEKSEPDDQVAPEQGPDAETEDRAGDSALLNYIALNRSTFPYFSTVRDDLVVNLGKSICEDLDGGYDPYGLAAQLMSEGPTADEAASFVGASIGSYCMQHQSKF